MDKSSKNSSDFSLFTQEELNQQKSIDEIESILNKYNILENENPLISSFQKNYLYIINYVLELQKDKKTLPKEIENLFLNNIFLKKQINQFLEKKLNFLTKDDNNYLAKDIEILSFILTIGANKNILNSNCDFNFDEIPNIFRFYEKTLQNLFMENLDLFAITFEAYLILLKTLIQICTINSIDLYKKKSISQVIELMNETINTTKFTIRLNDIELSKINNIQGKYLYYFSHLDNISIDEKDLNRTFEKYLLCLEKQEDGFMLSKNNNFGFEDDILEDNEFLIFRNYSSILLLKLIKKLKDKKLFLDFENTYFQKILHNYSKNFSFEAQMNLPKNINEFEKILFSSLLYNNNSDLNFGKKLDYHSVIENFILLDKNFDNKNLETIYRILFFASDIEDFKYNHISLILVNASIIKNDYYEYFKLAIFELFIGKFIDSKSQDFELLNKILNYLFLSALNFHLFSICARIFLTISTIYSKDLNKAKDLQELSTLLNNLNYNEDKNKELIQTTIDKIKKRFESSSTNFYLCEDCEIVY